MTTHRPSPTKSRRLLRLQLTTQKLKAMEPTPGPRRQVLHVQDVDVAGAQSGPLEHQAILRAKLVLTWWQLPPSSQFRKQYQSWTRLKPLTALQMGGHGGVVEEAVPAP